MNVKGKKARKQAKNNLSNTNIISKEELNKRIRELDEGLRSSTWKDLNFHGKTAKNEKISFINDDMLILGCDIGSETHYLRAIDFRGRELSREAFSFANSMEGFQSAKTWALDLAAIHKKNQIVLGLEPTGHYWFCLTAWMISNGISVVQVNPYAVKQTKEIEDNSQLKDDRKDPKLIANLVKDGNYGMPYLPEEIYADLRRLSMLRDQLTEDHTRAINRLHREMKIYFPEYKEAFGKLDGPFTLAVLKEAPLPADILEIGTDGLKEIWREAGLRGRGYSRADKIVGYAAESIGLKEGSSSGKEAIQWFVEQSIVLKVKMDDIEARIHQKCREIPYAENILAINGIGETILSGILAEMGDIRRFEVAKEIQKISGLGLVACSSGKHKGETRISHRGRKRLRYWLFLAAKSAVAHAEEFKNLHEYYTTRPENPLKKMQSLIVIACKILRIIFTILRTGCQYDPEKMMKDIRRPEPTAQAAA